MYDPVLSDGVDVGQAVESLTSHNTKHNNCLGLERR